MKKYPTKTELEYFKECFEMDESSPSGLKWKERPLSHFQNQGTHKKFNTQYSGKNAGTKTKHGYWQVVAQYPIGAHRVIWAITHESSMIGCHIDHVDGDGLNNKISNLRIATRTENARNRKVSKNKEIPLKGVELSKGRYRARIYAAGITYRLGSYKTAEEAHEAYWNAAQKIHKEFAKKQ